MKFYSSAHEKSGTLIEAGLLNQEEKWQHFPQHNYNNDEYFIR